MSTKQKTGVPEKTPVYTQGNRQMASQSFLDHVTVTLVVCWRARRPLGHKRTDGLSRRTTPLGVLQIPFNI
jgi:hypothetical protein